MDRALPFFDAGAALIGLDPAAPVLFEGSLAEGMGNASSDVDFLAIVPDGDERLSMPSVLFVSGRRVEFRFRSARQILDRARRLEHEAAPPTEADIDEWHRFTHGAVLRGTEAVEGLRAALPQPRFNAIVAAWQRERAAQLAQTGHLLGALGDAAGAQRWLHRALTYAAKAWLAHRGATYVEEKWLEHQLRAAGGDHPLVDGILAALADPQGERDRAALLAALLPDLTLADLAGLHPMIGRGTTTWRIGARTHVVHDRDEAFVLSESCAATWRALVRARTVGAAVDLADAAVREALLALWKSGLLGFRAPARAARLLSPPLHLWVEAAEPVAKISVRGEAALARPVGRYRASARQFVLAGLGLVWENILIENAIEDAQGALADGQAGVLATSIERILAAGCRSMLLARGVVPAPEAGDAVAALCGWAETGDLGGRAAALARAVWPALRAGDPQGAWRATEAFVALVREDGSFPRSFASREEWRDTIGVGYDWVRLGAYMGTDFPTAETREIVAKSRQ